MTQSPARTAHNHSTPSRPSRWLRRALTGLIVVGCISPFATSARADELDDQQSSLQNQIQQSGAAIDSHHSALDAASAEVASSRQALADAQAALAKAQSELDAARAVDQQKAAELANAEQELTDAKTAVQSGRAAVDAQQSKAAQDMRTAHQQNTGMLSIGMLFVDTQDAGSVNSRVQWASTLYNANSSELNRLSEMQLQLQNAQTQMATLENNARVIREAAAAQLSVTRSAEQAADNAAGQVSQLVAANEAAEAAAAQLLAEERAAYASMQAEMDSVTQQIQERNARQAAEAEAAAAAARAAAAAQAAAEAQAAAAAQAVAAQQQQAPAQQAPAQQVAQAPAASSGSGFPLYTPANGPYTSPYGYRTNPVLGYSELHDGLDIGASCNTPVYAASSGTVTQASPAASTGGWGNRVVLDNGTINGQQVSTGYNHMSSYIVGVGQWVDRGQVIGYIGTTGLSTGCHLHFHVWINGSVTNPAPYL